MAKEAVNPTDEKTTTNTKPVEEKKPAPKVEPKAPVKPEPVKPKPVEPKKEEVKVPEKKKDSPEIENLKSMLFSISSIFSVKRKNTTQSSYGPSISQMVEFVMRTNKEEVYDYLLDHIAENNISAKEIINLASECFTLKPLKRRRVIFFMTIIQGISSGTQTSFNIKNMEEAFSDDNGRKFIAWILRKKKLIG